MLTPKDLLNPKRKSGYNYVNSAGGEGQGHGGGKPWHAQLRVGKGDGPGAKWHGPRRVTTLEAAQDVCDFKNGQTLGVGVALKSHGHQRPQRPKKSTHPKRAAANRLIAEAKADESADNSGYVYLIAEQYDPLTCGPVPLCKIGKASDHAMNRLIDMQTGNGRTLVLLGTIKTKDRHALEKQLHARFIKLNYKAEWFRLVDEIRSVFNVKPATVSRAANKEATTA